MNCESCGAGIPDGTRECEYCGSLQTGAAAPAAPAAPAPTPAPTPAPAPPAAPRREGTYARERRHGKAVGLGVVAALCLLCGVGSLLGGRHAAAMGAQLEQVQAVPLEQAAQQDGMVCVEAAAPQVEAPYRIPGTTIDCLYVREERERRQRNRSSSRSDRNTRSKSSTTRTTDTHAAPSFQLGALTVKNLSAADYQALRQLHSDRQSGADYEETVTWKGIAADAPVTVIGRVQGGTIAGGEPFVITPLTSRAAVLAQLSSNATLLSTLGVVALVLCALAGAGSAVVFLKQ